MSTSFSSTPSSLVEKLAHQLSSSISAQTIYGTPIEREGVTVIPVAQARYGFGGGGGGAKISRKMVGYIEIREGRARFRRIRSTTVPLVAVSGLVALLLLRSVPKLLSKRK
jgi:uncharacterized spore protein YtfJ